MVDQEWLDEMRQEKAGLMEELAGMHESRRAKEASVREIRNIQNKIKPVLMKMPEPKLEWPMSHEQVEEWCRSSFWQLASTMPYNPHEYVLREWTDRKNFQLVVLHLREHGIEYVFGKSEYVQYEADGAGMWTMGAPLEVTVLINRKPVSLQEYDEERGKGGPKKQTRDDQLSLDSLI